MGLNKEILEWCADAGVHDVVLNEATGIAISDETNTNHTEKQPIEKLSLIPPSSYITDISNAKTLDQLRQVLAKFDMSPLKLTAQNLVFADGNPSAKIMLIGEAPGADEDRLGKPFVGMSGQLLDKMLKAINLDRKSVYITNIIPWRPPGNRTPTTEEITLFLPFVHRHIELINPKVIVCVGGTSAKALFGRTDGVMKMRGRWLNFQTESGEVSTDAMVIFHPAYLLRSPGQKALAWVDLLKIQQKLKEVCCA